MEKETAPVLRRLTGYGAVAILASAAFVAAWISTDLSRVFQGVISFAASVVFVVAFHEVAFCRGLLREMRRGSGHHA